MSVKSWRFSTFGRGVHHGSAHTQCLDGGDAIDETETHRLNNSFKFDGKWAAISSKSQSIDQICTGCNKDCVTALHEKIKLKP